MLPMISPNLALSVAPGPVLAMNGGSNMIEAKQASLRGRWQTSAATTPGFRGDKSKQNAGRGWAFL